MTEQSKAFFFEEKNQKTFASLVADLPDAHVHRRGFLKACAGVTIFGATRRAQAAPVTITTDRFSVTIQGNGPDVIFVPGLTCSRDVWNQTVAALGGKYRVHLVQIAGFAGEPARANAQGPVCADVAEGLAAYITQQNLQKPAYVGHSMGGTIGLMLAERHPAALGRLMVVDMFPALAVVMIHPGATRQEIDAAAEAIGEGMAHADSADYRKNVEPVIASEILTESARPEIVRQSIESDHRVAGHAMRELIETDLTPDLPKIVIPTTVLYAWNKADPYAAAQADTLFRTIYASLKAVKLVRIDGAAHFIFIDQPAKFDAALREFLA